MQLDLTPWRVKKLDDDSLAYLVPDADIKADGAKMAVRVIVSTETMDRERDILIAKGCDTRDHRRNPIVLLNHRKDWPGIARCIDPDGSYTLKSYDDRIEATNYFDQSSKLATQSFRLVESGALRGVSPGFMTVPGQVHKVKGHDGHPAFVYNQWKLVEISHCPIGMNPDALVVAVEKGFGGESMLPELKDLLVPYLPERKATATSGFVAKSDDDTDLESVISTDLLDDEPLESEAITLTPSTQFYQAMAGASLKMMGLAKELLHVQESDRTRADARRCIALFGKALDVCQKGHRNHIADFPDQPGVPGGENADINESMMTEWRQKALNDWDAYLAKHKRAVAEEDAIVITKAVQLLRTQARDVQLPHRIRAMSKRMATDLEHVKMVAMPVDTDDAADWETIKRELVTAKSAIDAVRREKVVA